MLIETTVAVIVAIALVRYVWQVVQWRKVYFNMPGEKDYSYLYGTLHKYPGYNSRGQKYEIDMAMKHKYFRAGWEGPVIPLVYLYHPDSLRELFKKKEPKPRDHFLASPYDLVTGWLGEGLITTNGQNWAVHRRLLTPAFHFTILQHYVDVYNSCAHSLVDQMKKKCSDTSVDIFSLVEFCTLDIILQCAFSYNTNCQSEGSNEYVSAIMELQEVILDRAMKPIYFVDFIYRLSSQGKRHQHLCNVVHKHAADVIEKRKAALENATSEELENIKNKKKKDFLDILLLARSEDGTGLSPLEIRSEVDTFMFAGHDTTSSAISWILYSLAQHPEYQHRAYQEVLEVLQGRDSVQWSDLAKLEYTTMCIKEGLRRHSPVPFSGRELTEDLVIDGYTIPAGSMVAIKIWTLHNNPHVWDDPSTFDPERFRPENQNRMDPFQFIPFSAGNRNCIGQLFAMNEMKVVIAHVLKNFILTPVPDYTAEPVPGITTKSANGVMVRLEPRESRTVDC